MGNDRRGEEGKTPSWEPPKLQQQDLCKRRQKAPGGTRTIARSYRTICKDCSE